MTWLDPRTSLRARLALAIGGVSLLLAFVLSLILGATVRQDLEEKTGSLLGLLASQTARQLDHELYERYHEVQVLASLDPLRNPHATLAEKRKLLMQLQHAYPEFVWVGVTDLKGTVLAATGGVLDGRDISGRPIFIKGLHGTALSDVHDAVLLSHLLPTQDEPLRLADISAPIFDKQGRCLGVLAAHLNVNWARGIEQSALVSAEGEDRLHGLLLSRDGTVLLGPKALIGTRLSSESARAVEGGRAGHLLEPWRGGEDNVIGYAPTRGYMDCPGLGWLVIVRQNAATAFAPARKIQQTTLIWGLALGLFASAVGWLIAGRITRPVTATALAADRLRQGIRDAALPVVSGNDEIAILSRSLQGLVNALTSSETRYRRLLNTANEGILIADHDDVVTYLNARMASMLGYLPEELIGKPFEFLLFPEDAANRRRRERHISVTDRYEKRLRHSSGMEVWGLASVSVTAGDDAPTAGTFHMITDITERKHAEDALRESEEQLRLAYRAANLASWDWNIAAGQMHWSALFEDLFGVPLSDDAVSYSDWLCLVVDEDREVVMKTLANSLETGDSGNVEYRILHPARGLRWMQSVGKVFWNKTGDPVRMLGVATDITIRKRQELELTTSFEKQSRIAETLQRSLLSKPSESIAGLQYETVYRPASDEAQVGGDYYDIFSLQRGEVAFVVGDVSGKGLGAAARTAEIKYALRAYLRKNPDPAYALTQLNTFLCDSRALDGQSGESFVALTLAVVTPATGRVQLALGGVDPPLLVTSDARIVEIEADGMPLGILPQERYDLTLLALNPGDTLLIATDGLMEARHHGRFLGHDGLGRIARDAFAYPRPLAQTGESIVQSVQTFCGGQFQDDVCLLLARRA